MIPVIRAVLFLSLLTFAGCPAGHSGSGRVTIDNPQDSKRQESTDSIQGPNFLQSGIFDKNAKGLRTWLAFTNDGRYRVANSSDFVFSEASKQELREMFGSDSWHDRIDHPAITGTISRQDWFYDLAVIVVDMSRTDARRFAVVVFNVPKEGPDIASPNWLMRECDLSSALLSWHSNWPVLVFYNEDGSADPYYINWDQKRQRYSLGKEQRGTDARKNSRLSDTEKSQSKQQNCS